MAGDETSTLLGSLERQRATFAWKCSGLDAAGMQATVGASTMILGGLVKHLALIEDVYFSTTSARSGHAIAVAGRRLRRPRLGVAVLEALVEGAGVTKVADRFGVAGRTPGTH